MKHTLTIFCVIIGYISYGQMLLSGTATGSCDCYTLTTTSANQAGSIWSPDFIDLTNPFDFTFQINLGFSDGGGADGMAFVLRSTGTSTGGDGGGLGYAGIINSLAIEVDTYCNLAPNEIESDHLAMNSNGLTGHDIEPAYAISNIEDGLPHDFRVNWDPITLRMTTWLDGALIFDHFEDVVTTIFGGNPNVRFGWTAGTGGLSNMQSVCIEIESDFSVDDTTACPGQELFFTDETVCGLIYDEVGVTDWAWTFGGGDVSDLQNLSYTYSTIGSKTIILTVTNMIGCTDIDSISIIVDSIDVEVTTTDVTCFGFGDGTATADSITGDAPFEYIWDDSLAQTTAAAVDLVPGVYSVMVTDDIGCEGWSTITINEPAELLIDSIAATDASCGINNGQIAIEATGGNLPYEYSIDGGSIFVPLLTFSGLAPGAYNIVVRDTLGCSVTDNVVLVNVSNVPEVNINADFKEGCRPLSVNLTNISDPTLTDVTVWDLGDGTTFEGGALSHTYENAGCYDIHVVITTYDGCTTEANFNDFICVWELPIAEFEYSPEQPDVIDNVVQFENLSEFASTYEWDFGDGIAGFDFEPSHTYPEIGNGLYQVRLIAITDKGCKDTAYQYVLIDEVVQYFIPNSFTPDGDEFNESFTPVFSSIFIPQDYHFVIYNRWGEMVWESYDYLTSWNGTYGDVLVKDGVYVWELTFRENGSDKRYKDFGHITVLN